MNNNDKNIISFGKHKSKTWNDVYLNEPKYCRWVENTMPKFYDFWLFQKYVIQRGCQIQKSPPRATSTQNKPVQQPSSRNTYIDISDDDNCDVGSGADGSYDCSIRCYKCNHVGHYARNCSVSTWGKHHYG